MTSFQTFNTGWVFVDSSNLEAVRYDPASGTLHIRFLNDSQYAFYGVPPGVHQGLMAAASKGSYHWKHIRNKYEYERVD